MKKLVADRVSQRIVDVFEAIQIQKQDRNMTLVTPRQAIAWLIRSFRSDPIGQTGQKVVLGRMGHLLRHTQKMCFGFFAHADVADRCRH